MYAKSSAQTQETKNINITNIRKCETSHLHLHTLQHQWYFIFILFHFFLEITFSELSTNKTNFLGEKYLWQVLRKLLIFCQIK